MDGGLLSPVHGQRTGGWLGLGGRAAAASSRAARSSGMVRSIHSATMIGGLGCTAAERRAATAADARSIAWKWQAAIHGGLPQLRPLGPRRHQHPPARARPHPRRARGPLHPRPRRQRHPRRPRHRLPHRHRRRPGLARGEADRVAAIADHTGDDAPALIAGILALDTVLEHGRSRGSRCWALRSVAIRQTPLGSLRQVGQGRQGRDPGGRPPFLGDPQNPHSA